MEKSQQKQQQEQQVIKQSPSLKHIEVKKSEIRREKSVSQPPIFKVIEVVNIPRPFKSNSVAMMKPQEQQQQQQPLERETTTQSLRKTTSKAFGLPVDDLSISITHRKSMMINGDVDRPIDVMNNTTTTQQQLPETMSAFSATEKTQETRPWLKDMIKLNKEMSQTKTNNNKSSSTKSSSESASESSSSSSSSSSSNKRRHHRHHDPAGHQQQRIHHRNRHHHHRSNSRKRHKQSSEKNESSNKKTTKSKSSKRVSFDEKINIIKDAEQSESINKVKKTGAESLRKDSLMVRLKETIDRRKRSRSIRQKLTGIKFSDFMKSSGKKHQK
ncbi:uncharacterized protein LOC142597850 [Dermatophagoides farinae]|uniref:uncharacterized protein LOC142597850 n=1 Tax=Dermatophagoides farinae TaxID=6954 RepID=UPI003F64139C